MLIPRCCKGCSGRKSGMCNCTLPSYCNEWVEDDETYPTNVGGVINTPNTAPSDIKIGDPYPCGSDGTNSENKKEWYDFKPTYEQSIGNWAKCPDCKDKDHRIAVLERALELACQENVENMVENSDIKDPIRYFIEQAEKELEEKK